MPANDLDNLYALRARLRSLPPVATTGSVTMASTTTGYTRPSGSFLADGIIRGMEVQPAGFPTNPPGVVESVTDTLVEIVGGRTAAASGAGRSLTVGLPSKRQFEGVPFTPQDQLWYTEEDYLPGPGFRVTGGSGGEDEYYPAYVIRLYCLSGKGAEAPYILANAILDLYRPETPMPLPGGGLLRVRSDTLPTRGQLLPTDKVSHSVITISVPLWQHISNAA